MLGVSALTKRYHPNHPPVVNNLSFSLEQNSIAAILGPSGCGKTTTLRLIAGFERPDSGSIVLHGQDLTQTAPEKRQIGFVFQEYALFPHLTVLENAMFGLHKLPKAERLERARHILGLVGLSIFEKRYPHQLSGGQQQRVALARALAPNPKLVLLDEPFSSLDAGLRENTRYEVREILQKTQATALLVTHDQEEAMTFADQLLVMRDGNLEQSGAPEAIYAAPRTAFVAHFLGKTNLVSARVENGIAETPIGSFAVSAANGNTMLSIRPEDLRFANTGVHGEIVARDFKGHDITFTVRTQNGLFLVQTPAPNDKRVGDQVQIALEGQPIAVRGSV
ncbi:MAG: ABC transporter ATP-binding protein [Deinococcales bacterium]